MRSRTALIGALLCACSSLPTASHADVTAEQAAAAVRVFEKDAHLQLHPPMRTKNWRGQAQWSFTGAKGSSWDVDAGSGAVVRMYREQPSPKRGSKPLPDERLLQIARKYVAGHCPGVLQWPLETGVYVNPSFQAHVSFSECLPDTGAHTSRSAEVSLHPVTGKVVGFCVFAGPVPAGARERPKVSREQAVTVAGRHTRISPMALARPPRLGWIPHDQRLCWQVEIKSPTRWNPNAQRLVVVDAQTGAVLREDRTR